MCAKLPPGDLNLGPCPPHSTNIYTYRVTTAPRGSNGSHNSDRQAYCPQPEVKDGKFTIIVLIF